MAATFGAAAPAPQEGVAGAPGTGGGGASSEAATPSSASALSAATAATTCEQGLRAQAPSLPPLVLAASAVWDGQPAVVLVFRSGDSPAQVYVTSQAGCRILHFERFQPSS